MNIDTEKLASELKINCPEIVFALVHGSAVDPQCESPNDIDLAVYLNCDFTLEFYSKVCDIIERTVPGLTPDVGILNKADVVYRFETLKGILLFTRDEETYVSFFSLTCREYESQMASYKRQHRWRLEAMNSEQPSA